MFNNKRYLTKGVDERIPLIVQLTLWKLIEEIPDKKRDYREFKKINQKKLKAHVKEHPDDTQQEMAEVFGCCNQAISKALKRCRITRKKDSTVQRTSTRKSSRIFGKDQGCS